MHVETSACSQPQCWFSAEDAEVAQVSLRLAEGDEEAAEGGYFFNTVTNEVCTLLYRLAIRTYFLSLSHPSQNRLILGYMD